MKLVPKFTSADVRKMLDAQLKKIEAEILLRFRRIGEEFVKNAREAGVYNDVTGNLRNSIGYVILRNGEQLHSNFRKSAKIKVSTKAGKEKIIKGGSEGLSIGKSVADEIAGSYPAGYVLIVVAGMDYAAAVESKGRDVLTGSSKKAETDLKAAIAKISKRLETIS